MDALHSESLRGVCSLRVRVAARLVRAGCGLWAWWRRADAARCCAAGSRRTRGQRAGGYAVWLAGGWQL